MQRVNFLMAVMLITVLTGCVVNDTRPVTKVDALQAKTQIAEAELLDVAIREFDAGIPTSIAEDAEALDKKRIYPEVRKAETRLLATRLKSTLEASGQWGAVRVVPSSVRFVDLTVTTRIVESTGMRLALAVTANDAAGRNWVAAKIYSGEADTGTYKTDAALRARDPFQNVYAQIANDLLQARERLDGAQRSELRQVARLRFAQDLAPQQFSGYLTKGSDGLMHLARLPAADDPAVTRIDKIRERDAALIDTIDGYNAGFSEKLFDSYGGFRRTSREAIEREEKVKSQARTRTVLGAAAVLAGIFANANCSSTDYACQRLESAARTAAAVGGVAAVMSGIKKYSDAKVAAQEVKELATSFQNEATPQVVEVEGRTLKLTGTAEERYREWRKLLAGIYQEDNSGSATTPINH